MRETINPSDLSDLAQHATQTIQAGSKSFATASRLFDPATRRSAVMLYAWCRHCDDVIDGQELGFGQAEGERADAACLAELRETTRRAYAGEAMDSAPFAAFQQVALTHRIPERYPMDHLDGYAMDVYHHHYETLGDTLTYCYRVAGVVGVMMAMVMGVYDEPTLDRACDLGLAFQLTNIARDIVEDAHIGRCYLPAEWLHEMDIPADEIADPGHRDALAGLAARLVDLAEPYYQSARGGLNALPPRSAWAIATAHGVYREIGVKVKVQGARAWDTRVSTSRADKLRLLAHGSALALRSRIGTPAPRPPGLWTRPESRSQKKAHQSAL